MRFVYSSSFDTESFASESSWEVSTTDMRAESSLEYLHELSSSAGDVVVNDGGAREHSNIDDDERASTPRHWPPPQSDKTHAHDDACDVSDASSAAPPKIDDDDAHAHAHEDSLVSSLLDFGISPVRKPLVDGSSARDVSDVSSTTAGGGGGGDIGADVGFYSDLEDL